MLKKTIAEFLVILKSYLCAKNDGENKQNDEDYFVNHLINSYASRISEIIVMGNYLSSNIDIYIGIRSKLTEQSKRLKDVCFSMNEFTVLVKGFNTFERGEVNCPQNFSYLLKILPENQNTLNELMDRISKTILEIAAASCPSRDLGAKFSMVSISNKFQSFLKFIRFCDISWLSLEYSRTDNTQKLKEVVSFLKETYSKLINNDYQKQSPDGIFSFWDQECEIMATLAKKSLKYFRCLCEIKRSQLSFLDSQFTKNKDLLLRLFKTISEKEVTIKEIIYNVVASNNSWINYASSFLWKDNVYVDISVTKFLSSKYFPHRNRFVRAKLGQYKELLDLKPSKWDTFFALTTYRDDIRDEFVIFLESMDAHLKGLITNKNGLTIHDVISLFDHLFDPVDQNKHPYSTVVAVFSFINSFQERAERKITDNRDLQNAFDESISFCLEA
jgi:hypothetical protein